MMHGGAANGKGAAMIRASMRRRLILFDIDGTLLKPMGLGRRSLDSAFRRPLRPRAASSRGSRSTAGPTSTSSTKASRGSPGGSADAGALIETYLDHLRREVDGGPSLVLPGRRRSAHPARRRRLGDARPRDRERAAKAPGSSSSRDRLGRFFRIGAFGDDHRDRGELVRIAKTRARGRRLRRVRGPRRLPDRRHAERRARRARRAGGRDRGRDRRRLARRRSRPTAPIISSARSSPPTPSSPRSPEARVVRDTARHRPRSHLPRSRSRRPASSARRAGSRRRCRSSRRTSGSS